MLPSYCAGHFLASILCFFLFVCACYNVYCAKSLFCLNISCFFYFKLCKRAVNICWPNLIWSIKQTLKLKRNSPQQFLEGIKGEQVIVVVNIREVFQKKVAIFFTFAIKRQTPPKMPKIGPIINKIEIWPKSDPK